ncbi:FAD-dependent monooxygenase [Rhodococcus jostii]|uniref:2-polyprenyl-6-methoxyphenol hydroxylase n=1 Tax=Rhodococcus jostii TaxID=132919 RepID=A0A1H4JCX5_RHOJO|nr:FAD-dependent monooxygenase [Rhodococcus jostii]SEB43945.1 2-polyprenyl-6-methoxyphenol hydroxylase [Rhodococcus jostii]
MIEVPVLVVGAGPVGMSLGLLLDRFGISSLVAERRPATTVHPKAYGSTARTMEHFRVWGIEDQVRGGGLPPNSDVISWCESLSGPIVALTHPEPSNNTPSPKSIVAQDVVEEALDHALSTRPRVDLRRSTQVISFQQDSEGVTALLRHVDTGEEFEVRSRYIVGCDGAASLVRERVGIEMEGPETLQVRATHYFRAPVGHLPHVRRVVGFLCRPKGRPALDVLGTGPDGDRWRFIQLLGDGEEPYSTDHLIDLVREYWGIPDLKVEPINVQVWNMSAQVAKSFRRDRAFLAGDAAHRFPPAGGIGMNSGIQDVHNLAWKLAAVLDGSGTDALLDTYETERHPVAWSNTNWSVEGFDRIEEMDEIFHNRHDDPEPWRALLIDQDRQINCEGQAMGLIYADSAAVVDDGSPVPPHDSRYYWPTDRPGARFPHMWLDAAESESTIDWFDTAFVLVCGPDATGWKAAGEDLAREGKMPLLVKVLPHLVGPLTLGHEGAALVRPDGHVAWRSQGSGAPEDLVAALADVLAGAAGVASLALAVRG